MNIVFEWEKEDNEKQKIRQTLLNNKNNSGQYTENIKMENKNDTPLNQQKQSLSTPPPAAKPKSFLEKAKDALYSVTEPQQKKVEEKKEVGKLGDFKLDKKSEVSEQKVVGKLKKPSMFN